MPYVLNGEPILHGAEVVIDGVSYSMETLTIMGEDGRATLGVTWAEPEPIPVTVEQRCADIDAERDRRLATDFVFDFGDTLALDDTGAEIAAGVRQLQMRPEDQRNWQALQGAALTAVVSGVPDTILPMRAEDNWNIQTTALQVLAVLAAMTAKGAALLFHGGALKSQQRAAYPVIIDRMEGWPS